MNTLITAYQLAQASLSKAAKAKAASYVKAEKSELKAVANTAEKFTDYFTSLELLNASAMLDSLNSVEGVEDKKFYNNVKKALERGANLQALSEGQTIGLKKGVFVIKKTAKKSDSPKPETATEKNQRLELELEEQKALTEKAKDDAIKLATFEGALYALNTLSVVDMNLSGEESMKLLQVAQQLILKLEKNTPKQAANKAANKAA